MQPRRGIFASPLPITSPSKRLNRKHSNTFKKCCCFKPTKLKVEPDEINQSKQKISSSPPPTTIRSWIYLILIIVVIQLTTDYILLQTAFSTDLPKSPPHLSNSLHSSSLTNNKRSSPPKQSFLAEFYHHATPMTAQPITTVTYNTIDFQPTASTSSKKYRQDWTTPIPIIPPTTNPTIDHPIHPIDPSNPSNPSTPIPSPPSFPPQGININAFSVLFRGLFHFDAVQYRFVVASSDNVRLWIDDHLILDEFLHASSDPTPVVEKILITFPIKGLHQITVEYQKKKIVHGQTNQEQQRRSTNTMQSSKQPNSYKKNGKNFDKKYCLTLPISMNGEKHPRGCPGAVLDTGSPSQDYCLGGNGKYPWWKKCCVFDDGKCISKTTKSWDTIANQLLSTHLHVHWLPDPLGLKIYMYDLPPRFNQEIVETNVQCSSGHMFGAEIAIHTSLTNSVVRTYDPREADLFYVPVYTSCKYLGKPFFGIDPWFGKKMASKSVQYIQQEFPFWNKRNGQDHVFAMTYDYGACYEYKYSKANVAGVLRILNNAILLSTISDATVSCFRPSIDVPIPTWIDPTSAMAETLPRLKSDIDDGDDVITVMHSTVFDDIDIDDNTTVMLNDEKSNGNVDKRDWMVYFQGSKEWFDHDPEYSNGRILGGKTIFFFIEISLTSFFKFKILFPVVLFPFFFVQFSLYVYNI